jgi:hypothetical protein
MAYLISKHDKTRALDNYCRTEIDADEEIVNSLSHLLLAIPKFLTYI